MALWSIRLIIFHEVTSLGASRMRRGAFALQILNPLLVIGGERGVFGNLASQKYLMSPGLIFHAGAKGHFQWGFISAGAIELKLYVMTFRILISSYPHKMNRKIVFLLFSFSSIFYKIFREKNRFLVPQSDDRSMAWNFFHY